LLGVWHRDWILCAPRATDRAIAEDGEMKDVAVRSVFDDHLRLQDRCGKIGIGAWAAHPPVRWLGFKNRKAS
jgi:hypothetical protein